MSPCHISNTTAACRDATAVSRSRALADQLTEASFAGLNQDDEKLKEILQFSLWRLEALRHWQREQIFHELKNLADQLGIKLKDFLAPLFVAISGTTSSFSVMDAMVLLGPDMSRARLRHALNSRFGEIGKKQMKKLEKTYQDLGASEEKSEVEA